MSPSWAYGPSAWIVHSAAKLAPEAMRLRLEEEWLADLSELDDPVLQLRFALGCCRAALAMRGDGFDAAPAARPQASVKFPFANRRNRVSEGAFTWLARLGRGLRDDEGQELRKWLRRRSHRAYITRAAAERDSPEVLAVLGEIFVVNPKWVGSRRGRSPTVNGVVALVAVCMASLPLFYAHYSMPGLVLGPAIEGSFMEVVGTVYTSGHRTLRRVLLPDGTRVVMNHGTRIAVLYSDHTRSVLLVRGEATFTVARQAHRAFDLTVADRLFGTEASTFNVRLTGKDAFELTVLEGSVTVPATPAAAALTARHDGDVDLAAPSLLKARQMIDTASHTLSARTVSPPEIHARIAWQSP